jgi:predicted RNA-binding Zn-ribbon protein involved in translation (DUF1610 family)
MNAKDKVSVTDGLEVRIKQSKADAEEKIKAYAAAAGVSVQELKSTIRSSLANHPCPKCGSETRRHQGNDGEDSKKRLRICSSARCREVFKE